jgi:predicted XRE-type DNA-binding protein
MKKKNIEIEYEISSGNVFADLGFPDAEEMLAKAELARQINNLIKKRKLTQAKAAELLGIDQPKISALNTGRLSGFSLERLFKFLTILGQDVTIKISKARPKTKANINVITPKSSKQSLIKPNEIISGKALHAKKRK